MLPDLNKLYSMDIANQERTIVKIFSSIVSASMAVGLLAISAPAMATKKIVVLTGTFLNATDATDEFHAGSDLSGKQFEMQYRYESIPGDTVNGTLTVGKMTVNGTSIKFLPYILGGTYAGLLYDGSSVLEFSIYQYDDSFSGGGQIYSVVDLDTSAQSLSLDSDIANIAVQGFGRFEYSIAQWHSWGPEFTHAAWGTLDFETMSVRGVPEPASWAMMVVGFGLVGGALRSRGGLKPA